MAKLRVCYPAAPTRSTVPYHLVGSSLIGSYRCSINLCGPHGLPCLDTDGGGVRNGQVLGAVWCRAPHVVSASPHKDVRGTVPASCVALVPSLSSWSTVRVPKPGYRRTLNNTTYPCGVLGHSVNGSALLTPCLAKGNLQAARSALDTLQPRSGPPVVMRIAR